MDGKWKEVKKMKRGYYEEGRGIEQNNGRKNEGIG